MAGQATENGEALEIVCGLRHDPIVNRLAHRIHDAAKQFGPLNRDHEFPNVLVCTNSDTHCGFPDLLGVLRGNFHAEDGGAEPIYQGGFGGRIRAEKLTIDLYVWLNEWKSDQQKGSAFFSESSEHYVSLSALPGSDPARHRHVG